MSLWRFLLVGALFLGACSPPENRLLIAPHLNGQAFCQAAVDNSAIVASEDAAAYCAARGENAASRISAMLDAVGPAQSPSGRYALGYMLSLPLMRYAARHEGVWSINQQALRNDVNLIHDVHRPVVVFFSANHFTQAGEEISNELAKDDRNLMWTRRGPLRSGNYFGIPLIAWTVADDNAPVTQLRRMLFAATASAVCGLDRESRQRIAAVTILGEVHQLFPDLINGAGFDTGFEVTDYSPSSIAGFRRFLEQRFVTLTSLNAALGSHFSTFGEISPPSADVLAQGIDPLTLLDASAAGTLAVHGWGYDPSGAHMSMALLIDGRQVQETYADLNRPDVSAADPAAPSPNVGWRFNYDYRALSPGGHTLQVVAKARGNAVRFGGRRFWVGATAPAGGPPIPSGTESTFGLRLVIDHPPGEMRVLYDPLAKLWLDFRNYQIRHYYEQFATLLRGTCLKDTPIYSYQMPPQLNPNWNQDLMAVSASQQPDALFLPGVDLYDGAAFGDAFFRMKSDLHWSAYGVGEINPSFHLNEGEMAAMLRRHRENGARYISPYYLNVAPARLLAVTPEGPLKRMRIAPDNPYPRSGGAAFYAAISHLMRDK